MPSDHQIMVSPKIGSAAMLEARFLPWLSRHRLAVLMPPEGYQIRLIPKVSVAAQTVSLPHQVHPQLPMLMLWGFMLLVLLPIWTFTF
jgi:hypothetical protein